MSLLWDTDAARDTANTYLETSRAFGPLVGLEVLDYVRSMVPEAGQLLGQLRDLEAHSVALHHDLIDHAHQLLDASAIVERHESLLSQGIRATRGLVLQQPVISLSRKELFPALGALLHALAIGASVPELTTVIAPPEWSLGARTIADWLTRTDQLGDTEFAISILDGPPPVAVVTLPGIHAFGDAPDSRDLPGAIREVATGASSYHEAVVAALQQLSLPEDTSLVFIGHSQGGIVAMDLVRDPRIAALGTVTHVVTAGSPISGIHGSRSVPVLELVNPDDAVPTLAGQGPQRHPERTVVTGLHGGVRSSHTLSGSPQSYATLISLPGVLSRPAVTAFTTSAAPWLTGAPASTTVFRTGKNSQRRR